MANWTGTAVPNSGYVEKVYFNTNLSIEEVDELIINIANEGETPLLLTEDMSMYLCIIASSDYSLLMIGDQVGGTIYYSNKIIEGEADFAGWNPNITFPINVDKTVVSSYEEMSIGTKNDKLSSLFSITPFEEVQDEVTLDSWAEGIADAIREKKGIEKKEEWVGTEVPNEGYVDKIYFNDNSDAEENFNILTQLNYIVTPFSEVPIYVVFANSDLSRVFFISEDNANVQYGILFADMSENIINMVGQFYYNDSNNEYSYGLENNEFEIEAIGISNYEGIPIGQQNELINFLSITPFEKKTTGKIPRLNFAQEIRSIEAGGELTSPTAVPISGMVEKVYFNFNVNVSKMINIIKNLTFLEVPSVGEVYPIVSNDDMSKGLVIQKISDETYILTNGEGILARITCSTTEPEFMFALADNEDSNHLQTDFSQPLEFGFENMVGVLGSQFPDYVNSNELLKEMISITPIQKVGSGSGIIEVDELPTENIDENAIYKIPKKLVDGYAINTGGVSLIVSEVCNLTTEIVNDKPTSNIIESDVSATVPVMHLYYVLNENDIFIYTNIGNGLMWVSIGQVLPNMIPYFQGITFKGETETTNFFPIYVSDDSYKQEFYGYYAVVKPEQYYKYLNNKWYKFDSNNYSDYYLDSISYASSKIVVPSRIKVLRPYAFYHHPRVEQIVIEDGLIAIEESAISWSYYLKSVVIGKGIKSIHSSNFYNCEQLTDIYFKGTQEEWNAIDTPGGNDLPSNVTYHFNYVEE